MNMDGIVSNLNIVLEKIFGSVEKDVFTIIDSILVIDKKIFEKEPLSKILDSNYMVIIANSLIILYFIYYIFITFISMYNGAKRISIYKFVIKIVVIIIIANSSKFICETVLEVNASLTYAVDQMGEKIVNKSLNFESLKSTITTINDLTKEDVVGLNGIIKSMISFGSISILITFAIRYVTVNILIFVSPIAIICLSSNLTKGVFETYVKMFIINLLIQNITKIIILIPLSCSNMQDSMYKIILAGSLYIIYKINGFSKEVFMKFTSGKIGSDE